MRKIQVLGWGLFLAMSALAPVWAEDVVYLKDGSVIHGDITEEVPGKKIKIETKDGNVFVYKMKDIEKITHQKAKAAPEEDNGDQGEDQATTVSPVKHAYTAPVEQSDPHAHFSKFGMTLNAGFWAPYLNTELNNNLEAGTGSTSYDYLPGWLKAGFGLGWFTNNLALKWNLQFSYQPNSYSTDWYYGGYYAGTTTEDTSIISVGSEVEADLGIDTIQNANNVTTFYLPLIAGVWDQEWTYSDSSGYTDTFSNSTTDFGTGIGFRGFDSSNFLWDLQFVYRWSNRGNYLTDGSGYMMPYTKGGYVDANVSGLDMNFTIGFLFK